MKISNLLRILGVFFFLTSCDSDSDLSNLADGGIGGTGIMPAEISIGPITGFGSIFVNGIEYDTSRATIIIDDQEVSEEMLELGMVVQVEGTMFNEGSTQGTAHRIEFKENVVGPLQSIDETNNSLVVLGQTVIIDQFTLFEGFDEITELQQGSILEISGLNNEVNNILATRIALLPSTSHFKVRGRPHHFDSLNQIVTIGDLPVDCGPSQFSELPPDDLIEIQGEFVDNRFIADCAPVPKPTDNFTHLKLHGVITRFNTPFDFDVDHSPVTVSSTTRFQFGTVTDLALGSLLKVTGDYSDEGILVAKEIEFFNPPHYPKMGIQANVEAIDVDNNQLSLLGVVLQLTEDTLFEDRRFNLTELRTGDRIEVHGFVELSTGILIIKRLHRKPGQFRDNIRLEGHPDTIISGTRTLKLFGIQIIADNNTRYVEKSHPRLDVTLTVNEFFSKIQTIKPLISVKGQWLGNVVLAKEMVILPKKPPRVKANSLGVRDLN